MAVGWYTWLGFIKEARAWEAQRLSQPPEACPYDYTPLKQDSEGNLFCPWAGDYTWPKDGRVEI